MEMQKGRYKKEDARNEMAATPANAGAAVG
jgi:hypothetical protein